MRDKKSMAMDNNGVKILLTMLVMASLAGTGIAIPNLSNSGGSSWNYYKEIIVKENSGKILTDYQVLVELNSENFNFSLAKFDGSDIRFSSDSEELNYWIEEWNAGSKKAKVWVKVPSIPANGETKIKMYYGNPSASAVSNGDKVFEFFDDFEGTSINETKWYINYGRPSVNNSILSLSGETIVSEKVRVFGYNYIFESRSKMSDAGNQPRVFLRSTNNYTVPDVDERFEFGSWANISEMSFVHVNDGKFSIVTNTEKFPTSFEVLGMARLPTKTEAFRQYIPKLTNIENIPDDPLYLQLYSWGGETHYVDWVRVRKYTSPEPAVVGISIAMPTSSSFLARVIATSGFLILIILTLIFPKENNRTKLSSYVIAGLSAYTILDIVSGLVRNDIFVFQNDFFVVFGGLGAAVFGILSRDIRMTASLAIRGFVSFIIGFAIFWLIVRGDPESAGPMFLPALLIWGSIHGIGLGSIYKNLRKTSTMAGASALGFLLALTSTYMFSKALLGISSGPPFGYGIFGGVLGAAIGAGMYYVSVQKEPEIMPKPMKSKSVHEAIPALATPSTFPPELMPNYSNVELIGEGGFAHVFKTNRKDGKTVAVKIPKLDEKTGRAFLKEVAAWHNLNHNSIVKLFDANVYPVPYLEMEYVDGVEINGKRIRDLERYPKPFEEEKAVEIIKGIAEGLEYAHNKGVVHRDIKPLNVLITPSLAPKITDFGLAKLSAESKLSTLKGYSPLYAAPEQLDSATYGTPDERTDLYQLGVIFYELLTGKLPYKGYTQAEVSTKIITPAILPAKPSVHNLMVEKYDVVVMRCLAKKKEDRYKDVHEFLEQLEMASEKESLIEQLKKALDEQKETLKKSRLSEEIVKSKRMVVETLGRLAVIYAESENKIELLNALEDLKSYTFKNLEELSKAIEQLEFIIKNESGVSGQFVSGIKNLVHKIRREYEL